MKATNSTATRFTLLRRRGTGRNLGCTRLMLARPEDAHHPCPSTSGTVAAVGRCLADPVRLPRHTVGEVSRRAVLNTCRQRKGESEAAVSVSDSGFGGSGLFCVA